MLSHATRRLASIIDQFQYTADLCVYLYEGLCQDVGGTEFIQGHTVMQIVSSKTLCALVLVLR